jgi:hypothetical protein
VPTSMTPAAKLASHLRFMSLDLVVMASF